ncbi:MAG: ketopantoate reductase family protein [Steroidobacteraceae bacterium]
MRFCIVGAGALGSILAAALIRSGHQVAVVARGRRADQLRSLGLSVRGLITIDLPCHVVELPSQPSACDVLILATKAIDTEASLQPFAGIGVDCAFSVQNGILKDDLLAGVLGQGRVLGAMADFSGELTGSGEVLFTRNVCLHLGELSGQSSPRLTSIAAAIDQAGVRTAAVTDIRTREWSKFVGWLALVPVAVLTRLPTAQLLCDAGCAEVLVRLAREAGALARAEGVEIIDLSPLPSACLQDGDIAPAIERVQDVGRRMRSSVPGHRMSCLQDIERGTPLEIEETLGDALERGQRLGIDMPTLRSCLQLLRACDPGRDLRRASSTPVPR